MNPMQAMVQAVKDAGAFYCYYKTNNTINSGDYYEDNEQDDPLPMSISLYISGGDDIEITKVIYNNKPLGIALNGDFSVCVEGCSITWYNLNYEDYTLQKKAERSINRKLEKEYLLKRLEELENEDE